MQERPTSTGIYTRLEPLCLARLSEALNPRTALFDRQLRDGRWDVTYGTEDLTSTAICLIGLSRAQAFLTPDLPDLTKSLEALVEGASRRRYPGVIGLVFWANAVLDAQPISHVSERLSLSLDHVDRLFAFLGTMEVAWLASGLAHEIRRGQDAAVHHALVVTVQELLERYERGSGLFYHCSRSAPLRKRIRRHVPNFADQIYAVQALSVAAMSDGPTRGVEVADRCTRQLVALQGPLGQWWWHYNARSGTPLQAYPVYSVHQYGMAPMALAALAAAGGSAFDAAARRSRMWLAENELNVSMVDHGRGTIWRDIEPDEARLRSGLSHACSILGLARARERKSTSLRVNHETRPYEWAWCLYAGAIEAGINRSRHIV